MDAGSSSSVSSEDDPRGMREIARDPISPAVYFVRAISRLHKNRPHTGISATRDIAGFVADKVGSREIKMVIALRFQDHSGRWFSAR